MAEKTDSAEAAAAATPDQPDQPRVTPAPDDGTVWLCIRERDGSYPDPSTAEQAEVFREWFFEMSKRWLGKRAAPKAAQTQVRKTVDLLRSQRA
jgi:hypothetical protein